MAAVTSLTKVVIPVSNKRVSFGTATLAGTASTLDTGLASVDGCFIGINDTAEAAADADVVHVRWNASGGTITIHTQEEDSTSGILKTSAVTNNIYFLAFGS